MKAAASPTARGRAVETLRRVLEKGRHAAPLIGETSRGLSPADQGLLRELVLGVLRWRSALDAEIAAASRVPLAKLAPNLREILEVALHQVRHLDRIPPYAAVSAAVDEARASGGEGAARLVNGVLRRLASLPPPSLPREDDAGALAVHYAHPLFLVERWLARFGPERTGRILAADNAAPLLDLLVNPRRTSRDALRVALDSEGIATEPSPLSPLALTAISGNPLRSPLFPAGHFVIQDIGSLLLPLLLPEGDTLVDLAAAPGGKSISAIAHGTARRAVALDRAPGRLARLRSNALRLALPEIRAAAADFAAPPLPSARFDRVILDAPCSGTGTLRKNPEIRYRVTADAIDRLSRRQEEALLAAAALLSPGGFLLYATCSLEAEENERVVERVLSRRPDLSPAPIAVPEPLRAFVAGNRFRILPDDRADGFTAHLLRTS